MAFWIIPVTLIALLLVALNFLRLRIPRDLSREGADDLKSILAYDRISRGPLFRIIRFYVMRQISELKPSGLLMDAGCGPGYLALAIARKFPRIEVIGIDLSSEVLNLAIVNSSFLVQRSRVHFQAANVQQLPFEDNSLDLTVSTLSLHHWPNPKQALNEIYRVLKPGGQLLIFDLRRDMPELLFEMVRFVQFFLAPPPLRRTNGGMGSVWSSLTTKEMESVMTAIPFSKQKILKGWGWSYIMGTK